MSARKYYYKNIRLKSILQEKESEIDLYREEYKRLKKKLKTRNTIIVGLIGLISGHVLARLYLYFLT